MEIIRVTWQINGLKNDTRRCQWLFGGFLYRRNKKTRLHKLIKHLAVCYCLLQFVGYTLAICTHIPRYNENIVPRNYSRIVIPVPFPFSLFPFFPFSPFSCFGSLLYFLARDCFVAAYSFSSFLSSCSTCTRTFRSFILSSVFPLDVQNSDKANNKNLISRRRKY